MIELRQLRYLIATADAGSFSRAARRLNIKQATLSRHVMEIERRLGLTLFDRGPQGVALTVGGTRYLGRARRLVDDITDLNDWVRSSRTGHAGCLTIGFYTSLAAGNLGSTITAFAREHIGVEVCRVEQGRSSLLIGLDTAAIDIAVMPGTSMHEGLHRRSLWSERLMAVAAAEHQIFDEDGSGWSRLADQTFLLTRCDPGPELARIITARTTRQSVTPLIVSEDVSRESLLCILAAGHQISIVTEGVTGNRVAGVRYRAIEEGDGEARIGFSAYWRPDHDNPALRRFLDFVSARYGLPTD